MARTLSLQDFLSASWRAQPETVDTGPASCGACPPDGPTSVGRVSLPLYQDSTQDSAAAPLPARVAPAEASMQVAATSMEAHTENTRPIMERLGALQPGSNSRSSMRLPALQPGEQYRFHFDMTRCIGCKCCEVACNEQNGNSAALKWRRVGEIEGGSYPHVRRFHVSMACNHCLEPSCLKGCPTDAYTKQDNGIVTHDAESCIGCGYCNWSCPYGVPQFNPERRVVTKCHMCTDRLDDGDLPACVEACPATAIEIEKVNVAEWRKAIALADAPGVPPADITMSTTRLTLPRDLPEDMARETASLLEPEAAHYSLVAFLVFSQISVGAFVAALATTLLGAPQLAGWLGVLGAATAHLSLLGTLFHLGRPVHALKAIRAWRRSWLSREVVVFSLYAGLATLAPGLFLLQSFGIPLAAPSSPVNLTGELLPPGLPAVAHGLTALVGLLGIYCSARIYLLPSRPSWNSWRTIAQFFTTSATGGATLCALLALLFETESATLRPGLGFMTVAASLFSALLPWTLAMTGARESVDQQGVRQAARLLSERFGSWLGLRTLALCSTACLAFAAPWADSDGTTLALAGLALALVIVAELMGRALFFVTVVPRHMPGDYFSKRGGEHG